MNRLMLFLLLCIGGGGKSFAQIHTYENTQARIRQAFEVQNWAKLLKESQEAIQKGTDFYDLRLQRGLAYLNQKKYKQALIEWEKCQTFFPADTLSKYYSSLAYLLLGNRLIAKQNARTLPDTLTKALGVGKSKLSEIGLLGSFSFFDAENRAKSLLQKETGEWNAYRGLAGGGLFIRHLISRRLSFTHSASSFLFQNFKKANYPNQKALFFHDGWQIGASSIAHITLPKRFWLHLAYQYNYIATYTQTFNTTKNSYEVADFSKGGLSLGGYIEKNVRQFDLLLGTYWNNFLGYYTLQETAGLTYQPFGNARLTIRGQFSSLQNLTETNPDYQVSFLYMGKLTAQVHKRVWLSASYLQGDTQNFFDIENNAIYYTADRTKRVIQSNVHLLAYKHLRLNVGYTFLERESSKYNILNLNLPITSLSYHAHQLSTGISWVFE